MTNQKHATVMAPQSQFRVLQTQQAHILALSIGTDNVLYRIMEQPGTKAGWTKKDESSALSIMFGNAVTAKQFDVSENTFLGAFDIALAVTVSGVDHLVLSLGNSNLDSSWEAPLTWTSIPFDDPSRKASDLVITDICLLRDQTTSYIVVDILKDPASPLQLIERYYIDPTKKLSGRYWNKHELAISLEAGNVSSRIGRKSGQLVGGIYTLGSLTSSVELIYSQIYNPYNPVHGNPLVSRFDLPAGAASGETAFALGQNPDGTTDLYVTAAGGLYYLAADEQKDHAKPVLIAKHALLQGVTTLGVDVNGTEIVVWGLNKFGKVFSLRNTIGSQKDVKDWSVPVPLLSNALRLSSLINRMVGGSVIFAHTSDDNLVQLTESPVTKLWAKRSIVLPPTDPRDMLTVKSYTTHIQLNGDDNIPLRTQTVGLTASSPCSVYINGQYTNLFVDTLTEVKTDERGALTIIQEVGSLGTVTYTIDADGSSIPIDPMAKAMAKLSAVKTGKDLDIEVTDSRGRKQPLVPPDISSADKEAVAKQIDQFVNIASKLPPDGSISQKLAERGIRPESLLPSFDPARDSIFGLTFAGGSIRYFETVKGAVGAGVLSAGSASSQPGAAVLQGLEGSIAATAGSIWEWILHAIEDVVEFFVVVVEDIATCFVKIAGEIYHFILDCVQSVANGINFILNKIKVFFDDLIKWLGFLFEWPDIVRTHRVLKNLFKQFGRYAVSELGVLKKEIVDEFKTIEDEIKKWANLPVMPDSASSIGGGNPPSADSYSPQAHWGTYHLTQGADSSQTSYTQNVPEESGLEKLLNELVGALKQEEEIFADAISQLKTEVIDKFQTLSLTDILKKVLAIIVDVILETVENVLVTTIDIIQILVEGVIDFLDAPLDVPIISQLYSEATEGDTLTILDAVCLVVAIPTTILYKIAEKQTPFPDNAFTNSLIHAPDFAAIRELYGPQNVSALTGSPLTTLEKVCFYVAVPAAVVIAFTTPFRVEFGHNLPLAVVGTVAYLFYCAPNLPGIVENDRSKWYNIVNSAITCVSLVKAFGDIGLTRYKDGEANGKCLTFWNKASPIVEFLINGFWFIPVIGAVVADHSESGIVACIANSGFNVGGMMALPMSSKNEYVFAAGLIGFLAGDTIYGFLDLVQAEGGLQSPPLALAA
jgi:hypothetical protein